MWGKNSIVLASSREESTGQPQQAVCRSGEPQTKLVHRKTAEDRFLLAKLLCNFRQNLDTTKTHATAVLAVKRLQYPELSFYSSM